LKFKAEANGVTVNMPDVPEDLMMQPAWVLKLSR
jgi:hypothetical protein